LLIVSMTALAMALFIVMTSLEAMGLDGPTPPPTDRTLLDWLNELTPVGVFMVTTTAAIWMTLHLALKPMRRLSERAGAIGPDTLHERLAPGDAPTELEPLVTAFNASLDRLESAWAAQRAFSANAAHELRTPLATLRAHVESLLPPGERRVATAEFERLARLIEQLLFLAEAERDHLARSEPFDLGAVTRATAAEMTPTILSGGRRIGFDSAVAHHSCRGDAVLAGVAIRNLIENAVRHTPKGTTISVALDERGQVTVRDDGPGVPEAFEDRLYDRFSRADHRSEGAGLGLSIVARIMDLHGGTVRHERPETGAAFVLAFGAP
ncbi:MAG: ATP-binding protein, partial [Brevundimonas sp.]|nr:ATP-binding protein [Brevundimonas sp.]